MEDFIGEHFGAPMAQTDPVIHQALEDERARQSGQIELIASENSVSRACLEALGSEITNKTVEGYPGNRFHGGADFADVVESAAIERAKELFGCAYANVQPHSGTQANQAVFFALLKPGDKVLSLDLAAGGHLSHGARPSQSGRWFDIENYTVDRNSGRIDYDVVAEQAERFKPQLLIAGGSAYPRAIDFARMRQIADSVGARFLVDMAHFAGLVAGGAHPSPLPHADLVTATTTKTLRGARGGIILSNDRELGAKMQSAVFPGVQGSVHLQVVAAKAVCLGEALKPQFRAYATQVVANARALAQALQERGVNVVSGGTDTHVVLLDLRASGLNGQAAQDALMACGMTSNKNPIPFDSPKPSEWVGLRLGSSAGTARGFSEADFAAIGFAIADVLSAAGKSEGNSVALSRVGEFVRDLCATHPLYR
jgi:glycine hydroxymethyltransferase